MSTSGGGGGGGGNFIPIADTTTPGFAVQVVDNPLSPGTPLNMLAMPGPSSIALAIGVSGESVPRLLIAGALGMLLTDGADIGHGTGLIGLEGGVFAIGNQGGGFTIGGQGPVSISSVGDVTLGASGGQVSLAGDLGTTASVKLVSSGPFQAQEGMAGGEFNAGQDTQGVATLVAGTVDVSTAVVAADSRILLTPQDGNTVGVVAVTAIVAGDHFTITSTAPTDTGVIAWELFLGPSQIT